MPRDLNKVQLIGHVGLDPDARYLMSGKLVCNMRLATSRQWSDDEGSKEETTWHNLVAWERLAEVANTYVQKGSRIYVEGRLRTRSWDDPESGDKRYKTEVLLSDLILLSPRPAGERVSGEGEVVEETPLPIPEPASAPPAPPRRPPTATAAPAEEPSPSDMRSDAGEPPFPTKPADRGVARQPTTGRPARATRAARPHSDEDVPF